MYSGDVYVSFDASTSTFSVTKNKSDATKLTLSGSSPTIQATNAGTDLGYMSLTSSTNGGDLGDQCFMGSSSRAAGPTTWEITDGSGATVKPAEIASKSTPYQITPVNNCQNFLLHRDLTLLEKAGSPDDYLLFWRFETAS
jgi:hypothetical protein